MDCGIPNAFGSTRVHRHISDPIEGVGGGRSVQRTLDVSKQTTNWDRLWRGGDCQTVHHVSVASQNRRLITSSTAAHYIDDHPKMASSKFDHRPQHGYNTLSWQYGDIYEMRSLRIPTYRLLSLSDVRREECVRPLIATTTVVLRARSINRGYVNVQGNQRWQTLARYNARDVARHFITKKHVRRHGIRRWNPNSDHLRGGPSHAFITSCVEKSNQSEQ